MMRLAFFAAQVLWVGLTHRLDPQDFDCDSISETDRLVLDPVPHESLVSASLLQIARGGPTTHAGHYEAAKLGLALPLGACFLVYFLASIQPTLCSHEPGAASAQTITVYCFFAFLNAVIFGIVIPDSYTLTVQLGGTAAQSGMVIATYQVGTAFGAVTIWMLHRAWPDSWRVLLRGVCWMSQIFSVTGMLLYLLVVFAEAQRPDVEKRLLLYAMLLGRFLCGFAEGLDITLAQLLVSHLTRNEDLPGAQSRLAFYTMVGLAAGPIVASGARAVGAELGANQAGFAAAALVGVAASLCKCVSAVFVRSVDGEEDQLQREECSHHLGKAEIGRRRAIVILGLTFSFLRRVCVSGVEAATVMILETELQWSRRTTGIAVGLAFFGVVPLRVFYLMYKDHLTICQWVRRMLLLSALASGLLFPIFAGLRETSLWRWYAIVTSASLLIGDTVLFSTLYIGESLAMGLISQHLLPREVSVWNIDTVCLVVCCLCKGIGRVIGPPLVRVLIETGGQNLYALMQVVILGVSVSVTFLGLLPMVESGPRSLGSA